MQMIGLQQELNKSRSRALPKANKNLTPCVCILNQERARGAHNKFGLHETEEEE